MAGATSPTFDDLHRAIRSVLGGRAHDAMMAPGSTVGITKMHDMACLEAFAQDIRTEDADVLREMLRIRKETGAYPRPTSPKSGL